jgi:Ca-activated chloride channel family protein
VPGFLRATAVAIAMVLVAGGVWAGYRQLSKPACSGQVQLSVAAAPEIAPAVKATAAKWVASGARADGQCVTVDVTAAEPVDVAAAIAGRQGVSLTGVGQANGSAPVPDVWVPDSSTWLLRLQAAAPGLAPAAAQSVARSSVVIAMPEPIAAQLGWPDRKLTYTDLLQAMTTSTQLHAGIVDPTRDATGLSGLLALSAAANAAGANAKQTTVAVLRGLAVGASTLPQDLLNKFPKASDATTLAAAKVSAAPLSEQTLIAYNAAAPPVRLAALYLSPEPPPLDYPYVTLPGQDAQHAAAADGLRTALSSSAFRDELATQGLRGPDGTAGAGFTAPRGAPVDLTPTPSRVNASPTSSSDGGAAASGSLDATAVDRALQTWTTITAPARMLAIIDVSGSMSTPVPTAGNATRLQVTVEAARRGLALFDDSWALGIWAFSTNQDGTRPWRQLVPIAPISTQRTLLEQSLNTLTAGGNTGLYDTMLAGYKTVQNGYDPGRVNSVLLFTDGQNDNASGITLTGLVSQLKKIADPKRPIRVIIVGIGNEVSETELKTIAGATGSSSGVYLAPDPSKIGEIFLQAIASR